MLGLVCFMGPGELRSYLLAQLVLTCPVKAYSTLPLVWVEGVSSMPLRVPTPMSRCIQPLHSSVSLPGMSLILAPGNPAKRNI